jgi:hypothetical protein
LVKGIHESGLAVQRSTTWYNVVQRGTTSYNVVQRRITSYSVVQRSTTWYNAAKGYLWFVMLDVAEQRLAQLIADSRELSLRVEAAHVEEARAPLILERIVRVGVTLD